MMPFTFHDGAYRSQWDAFELAVFVDMIRNVINLLNDGSLPQLDTPHLAIDKEAVLQRLLPASSKDAEVSQEFERLAGPQIREAKIRGLAELHDALVEPLAKLTQNPQPGQSFEILIPKDQAKAILQAFTSVRLYLAKILDIETDEDADLLYHLVDRAAASGCKGDETGTAAEQEKMFLASIFLAAGFAQETLVQAMMAL